MENYTNQKDANGKEIHIRKEMEDADTEEVTGPYILEEESKQTLDQQVKFTLGAYFKKIDVVNKLY